MTIAVDCDVKHQFRQQIKALSACVRSSSEPNKPNPIRFCHLERVVGRLVVSIRLAIMGTQTIKHHSAFFSWHPISGLKAFNADKDQILFNVAKDWMVFTIYPQVLQHCTYRIFTVLPLRLNETEKYHPTEPV